MIRAILIALCALMCSCQIFKAEQIMDNAERQLSNAPDSALNTMRSIRKIAIVLPERRARYGLLYSMALDKNYIDIAADSLIRFSTQYYDHKGSPEQRMRAYYYLGRTQENAGDNLAATLSFLDAAQYLNQVDDNYLKGLLCSKLAKMHILQCNYQTALATTKKSYLFYENAGLLKHQAFQQYELGCICYYMRDYKNSLNNLHLALDKSKEIGFRELEELVLCQLSIVYSRTKDYDNSYRYLKLYEDIQGASTYNYTDICGAAATTYQHKGNQSIATTLLKKGWVLAKNSSDSVAMRYYEADYLSLIGKKVQADIMHDNAMLHHLGMMTKYLEAPIRDAQNKYFANKALETQNRANRVKRYYICSIIMLMFCCTLYIIYSRRKYIQQNREIERYIEAIDSLNKYKEDNQTILSESLIAQFELINQLCQTYYEHNGSSKQQSAVFKEVKVRINDICNNDKHFETLSTSVNNYNDDILTKLKQDFPNLTSNEYKLACFMCVGFSTQTLCLFFNCNEDSIYNRKARLREKIKNKESEHKQLYSKTLLIR